MCTVPVDSWADFSPGNTLALVRPPTVNPLRRSSFRCYCIKAMRHADVKLRTLELTSSIINNPCHFAPHVPMLLDGNEFTTQPRYCATLTHTNRSEATPPSTMAGSHVHPLSCIKYVGLPLSARVFQDNTAIVMFSQLDFVTEHSRHSDVTKNS